VTLAVSRTRTLAATAAILLVGGGYAAVVGKNDGTAAADPRTAIAVLPFRNLSAADSSAYVADGLHEEILTQLRKVPALSKVIGRNSVMSYGGASAPPPLQQIASELGVGAIVDGSIQVVGNRARVNVRLMNPLSETPLWAEKYDRALDDIFAIQSDIAQQIVATVGAALTGAEREALAQVPTSKSQAYLFYLQGKEYERRPGYDRENFEAAARLYERALALDPDFALVRAALSVSHGYMYWLRYDMTPARLARQKAEAEAALRLAPDLPEARNAMATVHNVGPDTDIEAGLEEWQIALRGAPNDSRLWRGIASYYRRSGKWKEYRAAFEKALELDPRDVDLLLDYGGETYMRMGRYADALHWFQRAMSITGDTLAFAMNKAWIYVWWKGELDTLRAVVNGEVGRVFRRNGWIPPLVGFRFIERQPDSVLQLLREQPPRVYQGATGFAPSPMMAAAAHDMRGDRAAARAAYDSALAMIDSAMKTFSDDWPLHQARGMALAGLGRRDEALVEVRKMRESFIYTKDLFLRPFVVIAIAIVLAHAGETDEAINELENVLADEAPALTVHALRLESVWDPLREHPRFKKLLAKYGN
jgi:TolB-like protein/Flp pilus assembly protein TadD